jgi:hypothetical protein
MSHDHWHGGPFGDIASKALTVSYSAGNRAETSPEASSAPLPARDVAYEEKKRFILPSQNLTHSHHISCSQGH